jgi:hypothetical protein
MTCRAVELPVAEPVEAVPVGAAGGDRDGGGPGQHAEGGPRCGSAGVRARQQDLRGGERAQAVSGGDQPGCHVLDDGSDLGFQMVRELGQGDGTLPRPDQGLKNRAGQPVSAGRAGQLGAGPGPSLGRDAAQLVTQHGRSGDQHRGQRGAGSLGGIHGVIAVQHQQPRDLSVTVGAHLRLVRAAQQLTDRAHGDDRVALASPAAARVPGGIDLGDLVAVASQVPGQAQPVMPGAFDRSRHRPPPGRGLRPLPQLGVSRGRGGDLEVRYQPAPRVAQRGGVGIQMGARPDDQIRFNGIAHGLSSLDAMLIAAPAWREAPIRTRIGDTCPPERVWTTRGHSR